MFQNQIVELHALQKGKRTFVATWFTYFKHHGRFMACDSTKKRLHLQSSARSKDISWCAFWQPLFTFTQRAADSKACAFLLSAVSARMPLAVRSVIRSSMDHNEKLHASTKSNRDSIYWNPCGDSVSLAYKQWVWFSECYPYVTPPTHEPITCSFFHSTKPLNPPSPSLLPPSLLPLHLLLWTAGSQCVILFIPRFSPLRSPLHPSIPFFHVCSAVKPSWIRPASLVTCSLCWCWNRQC